MNKLSPKQLEQLEKQIAGAQEALSNLTLEVKVVSSKRSQLANQIEAETKRLLDSRKLALDLLEQNSRSVLEPLEQAKERVEREISDLKRVSLSLETDITSKKREYDSYAEPIKEIKEELDHLKRQTSPLEQKLASLQQEVLDVEATVALKQQQIETLSDQISILRNDKTTLEQDTSDLEEKLTTTKTSLEREVNILEGHKQSLQGSIIEENRQQDIIRRDLASRQLQLDQQDSVLRRREMRVAAGEDKLTRNSDLLNL